MSDFFTSFGDINRSISVEPKEIKRFRGQYAFLSNMYDCPWLEYEGLSFVNAESAYQSAKTCDYNIRKKFCILDGAQAKFKGSGLKVRPNWNSIRYQIMYDIVTCKFTQSETLRNSLINTRGIEITQYNDHNDTYWGVNEYTDEGENNLGKILMKVREEL